MPARLLVGRAPSCGLRLDDRTVSGEHARLSWVGGRWELRDLGSRNGTFVDGARLDPGVGRDVVRGSRLGFGAEEATWELADDRSPSALAEEVGGSAVQLADDGILALPSADRPELTVYCDSRGMWWVERPDAPAEPVRDGAVVAAGGRSWRIRLPDALEGTATVEAGLRLDAVALRFAVSMNEEHVELSVVSRGRAIALEPREHGYVLLTLARARIADRELPLAEQGWLDRDRLLKMLAIDANSLNVSIYRARGQLGSAGVDGAAGLVEVRRGQRRLGIEPERIEIVPL